MKKRILVVDDERGAGMLMKAVLPEYDVQVAPDCCAALVAALERAPDLFVLDILMPGLTGRQFADQLAASDGLSEVPVIFVSASVITGGNDEPVSLQGHAAFGKPFNLARLKREIERLLGQNDDAAAATTAAASAPH